MKKKAQIPLNALMGIIIGVIVILAFLGGGSKLLSMISSSNAKPDFNNLDATIKQVDAGTPGTIEPLSFYMDKNTAVVWFGATQNSASITYSQSSVAIGSGTQPSQTFTINRPVSATGAVLCLCTVSFDTSSLKGTSDCTAPICEPNYDFATFLSDLSISDCKTTSTYCISESSGAMILPNFYKDIDPYSDKNGELPLYIGKLDQNTIVLSDQLNVLKSELTSAAPNGDKVSASNSNGEYETYPNTQTDPNGNVVPNPGYEWINPDNPDDYTVQLIPTQPISANSAPVAIIGNSQSQYACPPGTPPDTDTVKHYCNVRITEYNTPILSDFPDGWTSGVYDYQDFPQGSTGYWCAIPVSQRGFYQDVKCEGSGIVQSGSGNIIYSSAGIATTESTSTSATGIYTASGVIAKVGTTIAIDPTEIKYGSQVKITFIGCQNQQCCNAWSNNNYVAQDTGSAFQGGIPNIDIYVGIGQSALDATDCLPQVGNIVVTSPPTSS